MADRVGMGVVGAGSIGIRAALAHLSQDDVQARVYLAAVGDPVPGRAAAAAERFDVRAAYESYEDLLADPNVDAVTLCTPIGMHYEQGLQAIAAGKHIHFNKTMTVERAEADDLIARAASKGVHLVASPGMMLWPHNQRARAARPGRPKRRCSRLRGAQQGPEHQARLHGRLGALRRLVRRTRPHKPASNPNHRWRLSFLVCRR